ncbi:MAG: hypothetical protein Q9N62_13615 [Ghiorsea sp.]|nr:hypothetical protein [Ghiorsea sp.]
MNIFRCLAALYLSLVLLGVIQFGLWGQVEYIYESGGSVLALLTEDHVSAHLSRYLLVAPLFYIQDELSVSANYLFSLLCGLMIVQLSVVSIQILEGVQGDVGAYQKLMILIVFIVLSLFMHGRIIFALLAFALIIREMYAEIKGENKSVTMHFLVLCMAMWMSSVSSGTFAVVYFFLGYLLAIKAGKVLFSCFSWRDIVVFFCYILMAGLFFSLFMVFLNKNVNYFGGFWEVLEHGFGKFFLQNSREVVILILANLIVIFSLLVQVYARLGVVRHLWVAILIGLAGGAFGYSTLSIALVPFVVFLMYLMKIFGVKMIFQEQGVTLNEN